MSQGDTFGYLYGWGAPGRHIPTVALRHLPFYGTPLSTKIILRCGAVIYILIESWEGHSDIFMPKVAL